MVRLAQSGFRLLEPFFPGLSSWEILRIIMDSNFSKLGPDGEPLYDERGKLLKGPGYWKPEPKIAEYLRGLLTSDG